LINEAAKAGQKEKQEQQPARELIHAAYPLHGMPARDKLQKPRTGERGGGTAESRHLKKREKEMRRSADPRLHRNLVRKVAPWPRQMRINAQSDPPAAAGSIH
jgi:hypothetical protein